MTSAFSPFGLLGVPAARPPLCSPGLDPRGIFATFAVQPLIFLSHFGSPPAQNRLLVIHWLVSSLLVRPASSAVGLAGSGPHLLPLCFRWPPRRSRREHHLHDALELGLDVLGQHALAQGLPQVSVEGCLIEAVALCVGLL